MEFEDRNPVPEPSNKNLSTLVLLVLICIVAALLYVGWNLMGDRSSKAEDLSKDEPLPTFPIQDSIVVDSADTKKQLTTVTEEKVEEPKKEEKVENTKEESSEEPKKEEPPVSSSSKEFTSITIKEGQTFLGIANKFNTTFSELKKLNPEVNPDAMKVGVTKVKVPIKAIHTVGPGDILRVVAEKYDVSVKDIMAANGKTKNFAERGEKLIIPIHKK
jgi:LysM repeat protein